MVSLWKNLTRHQRFLVIVVIVCGIVVLPVEFSATFLGAGLAAGVGVWLLREERSQNDTDKRDQLLTALASEVQASLKILRGRPTPVKNSYGRVYGEVVMVALPTIVVEECARSGLFTSEQTDDFFNLAGKIQVHNAEVTFFQTARTGFVSNEALEYATAEMKVRQCELYELYEEWEQRIVP